MNLHALLQQQRMLSQLRMHTVLNQLLQQLYLVVVVLLLLLRSSGKDV